MTNALGYPASEADISGLVQQLLAERHQWREQSKLAYYRGFRIGAFVGLLVGAIVGLLW
jgi:hypothetical protein